MSDETALALPTINAVQNIEDYAMSAATLLKQADIIRTVTATVMKADMHYGIIPGCGKKPTLLKPGAEKLLVTFRLSPAYEIEEKELAREHRQFNVTCKLISIVTGAFIGSGVGSCSTMESKYRFRTGDGDVTDVEVPKKYWDTRKSDPATAARLLSETMNAAGYEGSKFGTKKDDAGVWRISTHGEKVEHDNPADYYNTCMKMAKKRAMVDAVLTATAASDEFTQDIEDLVANGVLKPQPEAQPKTTASRKPNVQQPQEKKTGTDTRIKEIGDMVMAINGNNKEWAAQWLSDLCGKASPRDMTAAEIDQNYPAIKAEFDNVQKIGKEAQAG